MERTKLNKDEAVAAMKRGEKVRHRWFASDEWVTFENGYFVFEDGVRCSPELFWMDRQLPSWSFDWEIV